MPKATTKYSDKEIKDYYKQKSMFEKMDIIHKLDMAQDYNKSFNFYPNDLDNKKKRFRFHAFDNKAFHFLKMFFADKSNQKKMFRHDYYTLRSKGVSHKEASKRAKMLSQYLIDPDYRTP